MVLYNLFLLLLQLSELTFVVYNGLSVLLLEGIMKKGIVLVLLIGLLCVGQVIADDNGPWSVGMEMSYLPGIIVSGGYETLNIGVGILPWGSPLFGFSANWFYPFDVADTVRLGPGIGVSGVTNFTGIFVLEIFPLFGIEYNFYDGLALTARIGYPSFEIEVDEHGSAPPPEFNLGAQTLLFTTSVGVKYYF